MAYISFFKKRIKINKHPKQDYSGFVRNETKPIEQQKSDMSIIDEQQETPLTTKHSPESVKEKNIKDVRKNPFNYIEINIVESTRVIDSFYISSSLKSFTYKKNKYTVDEEYVFLLPSKAGYLMPISYYKENVFKPISFRNINKGITAKAVSLLYNEKLYESLFYADDLKYNLFIVILSVAILITLAIACYLLFVKGAEITPVPENYTVYLIRGLLWK